MDFSNLKVLVIGDVCLDIIEEGTSNRMSPEAPVPVILNPSTTYSLGMAANVALNLHSLGADIAFTFITGDDKHGEILIDLFEKNMNGVTKTLTDLNIKTIVKKRIIANGQQVARIDFEEGIDKNALLTLYYALEKRYEEGHKYDLIIISDYNKGIITKESWSIIRPLLEQLSDNFFVDTKKLNVLDFYEGMYIFPNTKEMEAIMEYNNCETRNELRKEMDLDFIVETASELGAFLYKHGKTMTAKPYIKDGIIDVTGAGDTFLAAFALYYTKFKNTLASLDFANYCCSKVVMRKGTTPVYIHEVMDFDYKGF